MNGNINDLLARYMEGETTQEEQRLLAEYLRQTDPLPTGMKPYKQMFDLIGERPEVPTAKALENFTEAEPSPRRSRPSPNLSLVGRGADTNGPLRVKGNYSSPYKGEVGRGSGVAAGTRLGFLLPLAAACLAAFAFILLMSSKTDENLAIAYIDGQELTDQTLALQMGQEALAEIFSNGNQEQQLTELFNEP